MDTTDANFVRDWPAENVAILEKNLADIDGGALTGMPQGEIDWIRDNLNRQLVSARKILEMSLNAD